jgi:nitrous oxidase accessory protein NosD
VTGGQRAALLALVLLLALPPPGAAQSTDPPIAIHGDDDLATQAAIHHWAGAGTPTSPYVIGPYDILAASGAGVTLVNTTRYVTLEGIRVSGGGATNDGIVLLGASHVTIDAADLEFDRACVSLAPYFDGVTTTNATLDTVRGSTLRACKQGIALDRTSGVTVSDNAVAVSDADVRLSLSPHNTFLRNNLSIAGQIGFSFADETSYNNSIDATNVVNFVSMRWHVFVRATAAAPATFSDDDVRVKGMTDVAQVMCYLCAHVNLVRPRGDSSSAGAAGIAIVRGSEVVVTDGIAESDASAGVLVTDSARVNVTRMQTNTDEVGVQAERSANLTLTGDAADGDTGAGILLRNVQDSLVDGATVTGAKPGPGLWLDGCARCTVTGATARGNAAEGARVSGGSVVRVLASNLSANGDGLSFAGTSGAVALRVDADANAKDGVRASDLAGATLDTVGADGNGANGIELTNAVGATVRGSHANGNAATGIVLGPGTLATRVTRNEARDDGAAGIWLTRAGPQVTVDNNTLTAAAAGIRLTSSASDAFDANAIARAPQGTGFVLDDEASYENDIAATNTVSGTPMAWLLALAGTSDAPAVVSGLRVLEPNMTNVGQVVLYKSGYVRLSDVVVANGTRGIEVLRSSSVRVTNVTASDSPVGIDVRSSQSVAVDAARVLRDATGVLVTDTTNASISDVTAAGSSVAVAFGDTTSRNGIVQQVNATGVRKQSVSDPTFVPATATTPARSNHLVVDAGLDKIVAAGANVTFSDAVATARSTTDRIVRQAWDFGDGQRAESTDIPILRPAHAYAEGGDHVATFSVQTASGLTLRDTVLVRVFGAPPAPRDLAATRDANATNLTWSAVATREDVLYYSVYRGANATNLTLLANTSGPLTNFTDAAPPANASWYAVRAVTALNLGDLSAPLLVPPYAPPPPANATNGTAPANVTTNATTTDDNNTSAPDLGGPLTMIGSPPPPKASPGFAAPFLALALAVALALRRRRGA